MMRLELGRSNSLLSFNFIHSDVTTAVEDADDVDVAFTAVADDEADADPLPPPAIADFSPLSMLDPSAVSYNNNIITL